MRFYIFWFLLLTTQPIFAEPMPEDAGVLYIYQVKAEIADVKQALEMAITNQGLLISNTLHISEMLNRTGTELGFPTPIYQQAEAFEFCSALLAHKMAQLHPANIAICPLTISFYRPTTNTDTVYIAFRKINLIGTTAKDLSKTIETLLQNIITEAIDSL
ncbi:hypothetical protein [Beggiatoa leptomitoformis]|uniref:DUF302 domain-containing protein n=1 Tax=Beggiatoa leptomitoformis TaxID=288004 RepID=A0A2N9YI91_9GAMM|nr:hypothetical protein [Beggiatoa leptomitoformis]ALG67506.1 hypothetical protein AL038_07070 [Beggiatoa leptomitoformis]AUI70271.1 hypothetical protein BLE401_17240 [Beggiatoa leptomitoformis]